jgi:hypothetical protein
MRAKTPLVVGIALVLAAGAGVAVSQRKGWVHFMEPRSGFWGMLATLEDDLPLTEAKLRKHLHATFKAEPRGNGGEGYISTAIQPDANPLLVKRIWFYPGIAKAGGRLIIAFEKATVPVDEVAKRFPGGSWAPPAPPGYGPADAGASYFVDRPWGRFSFSSDSVGVRSVTFEFGIYGSPGV